MEVPFSKWKWPCPFNMFKDENPGLHFLGIHLPCFVGTFGGRGAPIRGERGGGIVPPSPTLSLPCGVQLISRAVLQWKWDAHMYKPDQYLQKGNQHFQFNTQNTWNTMIAFRWRENKSCLILSLFGSFGDDAKSTLVTQLHDVCWKCKEFPVFHRILSDWAKPSLLIWVVRGVCNRGCVVHLLCTPP